MKQELLALSIAALAVSAFGEEPISSGPIVPGEWNSNYKQAQKYAEDNGMPFIALVSQTPAACHYCSMFHEKWTSDTFVAWAKDFGAVMGVLYSADAYGKDSSWCDWVRGSNTGFPMIHLYWPKKTGSKVSDRFMGRAGSLGDVDGDGTKGTEADFIARIKKAFAGWQAKPPYTGGAFADPDTEGNRLEFESGTASVKVNLSRKEVNATNVTFKVMGPTGSQLKSETVNWAADETNKTVEVVLSSAMKQSCTADGQQLTLYLADKNANMATNHITFVKREPSAANPLWIGERKNPYANGIADDLQFGEWTMDLELAKQFVRNASGAAYTLVSIQGSMWCPDCANTDRNFLEAKDASGNNRFCAWAKAHSVALVSMDVPNYSKTGSTPETVASPTLFSKKAFETTLARAKEYPQSGAPETMTKPAMRSGLGYLTRKGATDEQAAEVMAKFHDLAVTNTDKGGFHRPEDTNAYRTGVPIFVLLRKDGTVAARFTRFASASPMAADQANFDNYIKRFEEMLAIAASTGDHKDPSEIENNYPGDKAISFAANGGTAKGEICNADFQDAFKLTGVGGNADQKVTVKGDSDAQVSVQFWQKAADGSFKTLGNEAKGKLSDGVDLTQSFTEGGDYYLLVKGVDITSAAFDAASSTASHFIGFEVKGSTVLVPQEDRVTANAPAGSDKVMIRLNTDTLYCFSGVTTNDNPFLVEVAEASPFRFLKSTEAGDVELKISTGVGGEITYQIWNPGQVGFIETERTVPESVNDEFDDWVEFKVARTGGKSGRVKGRVTIDPGRTTMDTNRQYVFETNALNAVDFLWEDGVTSNMTVRVKIIDDEYYDGDYQIAFNLEVLASDAGDVTVKEGAGSFILKVLEDDKDTPGRGMISATDPECAKKGTVYVRESEGAKIWVERIEASSGLVRAEIASSVPGTGFATEDPRDMTNELGRTYIWWSSREMTRKYVQVTGIPAGRTARIQLKSHGNFKVVSASNTVTVVSIADDAPAFKQAVSEFNLNRYLDAGDQIRVGVVGVTGEKVSFTKLSGTLPAGLKAAYDAVNTNLVFSGKVTAKPGAYTVNYQVSEMRGGKRIPGLTTAITFVVTDPTDVKTNPEGANPSVAVTRTIKDIAVVNPATKRLVGVLQLTIPPKGNLSGKYVRAGGTVSLTTKNWKAFDPGTKQLGAVLENKGVKVTVLVNANGSLDIVVDDPNVSDIPSEAYSDGLAWSDVASEPWKGYYTVVLPVENVVSNATDDLAPTGSGYLTLDFTSKSALRTGTFKWAGLLPNGTAVSGSSVLGITYAGKSAVKTECNWANLSIFKQSSTDVLSVYLKIRDLANTDTVKESDRRVIWAADDVTCCWEHGERATPAAAYKVDLGAYGAIYDKTEDLGACCLEYYKTQTMLLGFDVSKLVWTSAGAPDPIRSVGVTVSEKTLTADPDDLKAAGATLSFSRATGVVSGSVRMNCESGVVSARYKGVILTGWAETCCGVAAELKVMPFVNGCFFFNDKVMKKSVKRGGSATVDVAVP